MTARHPAVQLVLELWIEDDEHVAGQIGRAGAPAEHLHPFIGWTELAAAIERLRKHAAAGDSAT